MKVILKSLICVGWLLVIAGFAYGAWFDSSLPSGLRVVITGGVIVASSVTVGAFLGLWKNFP